RLDAPRLGGPEHRAVGRARRLAARPAVLVLRPADLDLAEAAPVEMGAKQGDDEVGLQLGHEPEGEPGRRPHDELGLERALDDRLRVRLLAGQPREYAEPEVELRLHDVAWEQVLTWTATPEARDLQAALRLVLVERRLECGDLLALARAHRPHVVPEAVNRDALVLVDERVERAHHAPERRVDPRHVGSPDVALVERAAPRAAVDRQIELHLALVAAMHDHRSADALLTEAGKPHRVAAQLVLVCVRERPQ